MGAERNSKSHSRLNEMVDFGPEDVSPVPAAPSKDVSARLQRLLKQLQELSRRVDNLANRD